jgi:gas vesicle protein
MIFVGVCILFSSALAFAGDKGANTTTVGQSIRAVLDSINEIIKYSIRLAEAELVELQRDLKEKGNVLHKKTEKKIVEGLQKILGELRDLEKALKENLEEGKELSREERERYRKRRDELEEKLARLKERVKEFANDMAKELRSLKGPIRDKINEILEELQKIINRMEERLKKQKQINETRSI